MATTEERQPAPTIYQIKVPGRLSAHWSAWFDGLTITYDPDRGETSLQGPVTDQAALHGLLSKIRDLGLPLLFLTRIEPEPVQRRSK